MPTHGQEKLIALVQESLSVATRTVAAKPSDFSKVVDTSVPEKAIAFPIDVKAMYHPKEPLVRLSISATRTPSN